MELIDALRPIYINVLRRWANALRKNNKENEKIYWDLIEAMRKAYPEEVATIEDRLT